MPKILIVDDDPTVVTSTADMLKSFSFDVITATDGRRGFDIAVKEKPDVIILDWMMPEYNGMNFINDYRNAGYQTQVLFLTGKGDLSQYQVEALRAGADAYLSKPYDPAILVERIRAMIRRNDYSNKHSQDTSKRHEYCGGELIIDNNVMQAFRYEESCELTNREFQLLQYLEENSGRVCSRAELLKQVWKFDFFGDERAVDVTIKRTRQKIEPDQKNFKYIVTRRGFGYSFPNGLN